MKYIPNILSFSRIAITPFFILFMLKNSVLYKSLSLLIFFLGSLSDLLDGYIARKYNYITNFGKYLDPLSDKILIISGFLLIHYYYSEYIPLWMIAVIILRDLFVTIFRLIIKKDNQVMRTSRFAKFKTLYQIIFIHYVLIIHVLNVELISNISVGSINLIYLFMSTAVIITVITGLHYFIINSKHLSEG